jgi:lactoylglutathione lyase
MITRIGHYAIRAKDIEKTASFYREVLGLEEAFRMYNEDKSLGSIHMFIAPSQYIEIFPNGNMRENEVENQVGYHHICLEVDNIEAAFLEISGRGAPLDSKIKKGISGCIQFWTHDPDGNAIEFMELPEDCLQSKANQRLAGQ